MISIHQIWAVFVILFVCHGGNSFKLRTNFGNANERKLLTIVSRSEWWAKPPKHVQSIGEAVPYVIIHHFGDPCYTYVDCLQTMYDMQLVHQAKNGWDDVAYNFAIGSDGRVYEGRGFGKVGFLAPNYNDKSIGIAILGDYEHGLPPKFTTDLAKDFIAYAVEQGHLLSNYTIYGHRQLEETNCPGEDLFDEIKTWPHFGTDK